MYHLNYYNNLKSPEIIKSISIDEYVNLIKDKNPSPLLIKARNEGKGSSTYEITKRLRPCVTFNFLFHEYKRDNNIISSTGLLYFDIDVPIASPLDYSKILIHHKSFGGNGNVIVVRVNGITIENFRDNYIHIATQLGIQTYIDKKAIKKTQYTVISFDKDIFYNPDSNVFEAINEKVSFVDKSEKEKNILPLNDTLCNTHSAIHFRMTNASDYVVNGKEYQVFEGGIDVAKVDIPRNIQKGNRKNVLLTILNQIVSINTHITYGEVTQRALMINHIITKDPLPEQEVIGAVNSIWRYKREGTLKPKLNKARKLIFSEYCSYSKDEKVTIVNKEIGALRSKKTKQEIYTAIEDWNLAEKITQKRIAIKIQKSLPTIKRHWGEFKELVEIHNNTHNLKIKHLQGQERGQESISCPY